MEQQTPNATVAHKRNFRSRQYGRFTGRLAEKVLTFDSSHHLITLSGKVSSETLVVPDFMLPEARQVMKRGTGDTMLEFARLCIVHEAALKAWDNLAVRKPQKPRKAKPRSGARAGKKLVRAAA